MKNKIAKPIKDKDIKVPPMWKVNTPSLLKEVLVNPSCSTLATPLRIFGGILYELAERAIELKDDKLNAILCRMALFEQSDPYQAGYDSKMVNELIRKVYGKPTVIPTPENFITSEK